MTKPNQNKFLAEYIMWENEAWAVVSHGGPAWAISTTENGAWEQFRATRDDTGIDPDQGEDKFQLVRITPDSALAVLEGNPDAWEAVNA